MKSLHAAPSLVRIEVRPGEGGDDAVLFASELVAAVMSHARRQGHQIDVQDRSDRTVVLTVDAALSSRLRVLAGVHRVQRESVNGKGKRHTSTATVAVLDVEGPSVVLVDDEDLDIDVFRSGGKGGQHAQKNSTAVRVTHRPSGLVVTCQDERSQWRNLQSAKRELQDRLQAQQALSHEEAEGDRRRAQIRSGERPVKQFTHNWQRGDVTDHATGRRWRLSDFRKGRFA